MIKQKMIRAHLKAAEAYSTASYAKRLQVGVVIVNQLTDQPVSLGWNGMPPGEPNVCEVEVEGQLVSKCDVVHAEINAIQRIPAKLRTDYLTLFCTDSPCPACAKAIVASGIRQVIFMRRYRLDEGIVHLLKNDVEVYDGISKYILQDGKIELVEADYSPEGFLMCRNYLKRSGSYPYGLKNQKQGWKTSEQRGVIIMFDNGASSKEIVEHYDRSYGSVCSFLQRTGRLSWSEHLGYMKTVSSRQREVWCSLIQLEDNNDAITRAVLKERPAILDDFNKNLPESEIIDRFKHISPCFIREIYKSSIIKE